MLFRFNGESKSILCQEDEYLLELVRYIHLNPVRAGMVKSLGKLDRYRWSGHSVLVGCRRRTWQDRDEILSPFNLMVEAIYINSFERVTYVPTLLGNPCPSISQLFNERS